MRREFIFLAILMMMVSLLVAVGDDPIVAEIGTRKYTKKDLLDGFTAYREYQGLSHTLSAADSTELWNQYWEELVAMYIYDAAVKSGRITVSQKELETEIRINIPDGVKQIKDLYTKGVFDPKKYEQALKDRPAFQESVINLIRDMYSYRKLVDTIKAEVDIDADSVQAAWFTENTSADAKIIYFDYSQLRHIQATEEDILAYYNDRLDDYRRSDGRSYYFVRFDGITAKASGSAQQSQKIKASSTALYTRAKQIGLQAAALELGYEVQETPMFSRGDGFIRMIGRDPALIIFAFSNPIGSIPGIVQSPSGDFFVCEVARAAEEYYLPLEIEKPILQIHAGSQKRMQAMRDYVTEFMLRETPDTYLQAAARDSLRIVTQTGINAASSFPPIGKVEALNLAILNTPAGQFTPLIEKDGLYYLALVERHHNPDQQDWEAVRDQVLAAARARRRQDHLDEWYRAQRAQIRIVDQRHLIPRN